VTRRLVPWQGRRLVLDNRKIQGALGGLYAPLLCCDGQVIDRDVGDGFGRKPCPSRNPSGATFCPPFSDRGQTLVAVFSAFHFSEYMCRIALGLYGVISAPPAPFEGMICNPRAFGLAPARF